MLGEFFLYLPEEVGLRSVHFLALLDYVSRAHEIEICLSSVVRPSSVSQLFFQISVVASPDPYAEAFFLFFEIFFFYFFFANIFRFG